MATKKNAEPTAEKTEKTEKKPRKTKEVATEEPKPAAGGEMLQKAAKAIGSAIGTVAVKTGLATPPKKKKIGKLVKKTKSRLPRKEKKAAKKKLLNSAG